MWFGVDNGWGTRGEAGRVAVEKLLPPYHRPFEHLGACRRALGISQARIERLQRFAEHSAV
jgi:hypothetical protein